MTERFVDKFTRADGDIGTNYTIACGGVIISDEAVIPIDADAVESGLSPLFESGQTAQKTQVLYTGEAMDRSDYVVRTTWARDDVDPGSKVTTDPSFTILARMSKDPLLYDLGTDEEPNCYDQGYGLRFTFPLDGTAPTVKIIKFSPRTRLPGLPKPTSVEVDGAIVLASQLLDTDDLNLDPSVTFDADSYVAGTTELPYEGQWQEARLRIRREDDRVILEGYLNDRHMNQVLIEHTDFTDPLWGAVGVPGFEFLSATLTDQPAGSSPFALSGLSLLRCGIFQVETFLDVRQPVSVQPGTHWTYQRVVNAVIELVERNGDARYNATAAGQTKIDTYLRMTQYCEADIIREEGQWEWLRREQRIYLINGRAVYEMPEDFGVMEQVRPGNWNFPPLDVLEPELFRQRLGGTTSTNGRPTMYTVTETGPNSRPQIRIFPVPADGVAITPTSDSEDPFLIVEYFARMLYPSEPDVQIPFVPQQDMDVLIWGAAAHALALDTDDANAQRLAAVYTKKLRRLKRNQYRRGNFRSTIRSAADVLAPSARTRSPITRATQLENLLVI